MKSTLCRDSSEAERQRLSEEKKGVSQGDICGPKEMDMQLPAAWQTVSEDKGNTYCAALKGPTGPEFKVYSPQTLAFEALKTGPLDVLRFLLKFQKVNYTSQDSAWGKDWSSQTLHNPQPLTYSRAQKHLSLFVS